LIKKPEEAIDWPHHISGVILSEGAAEVEGSAVFKSAQAI
jgi:hypothetical protein